MKINRLILILLVMALILSFNVYAADALYRLMHNDHLALVIGEVVEVGEKSVSIRVEKNIVSTSDMNNPPKTLVTLSNADIRKFEYFSFNSEKDGDLAEPAVGDYILASLEES